VKFDPKRLKLERVNVEATYHATWTFSGLKGVIAERWAHGPIFGAVTELGTTQMNLTPAPGEDEKQQEDLRLIGVLGYRTSGLVAEGGHWTGRARDIANEWFKDIYSALKPERTVVVKVELVGLYPIRDAWRATQRLRLRYYQDEALTEFAGGSHTHAAVEVFASDDRPQRSLIMGVLGPPHRGLFFTFPKKGRDDRWWMALRVSHQITEDRGIEDPLDTIHLVLESALKDWERVAREAFPGIVE
jgi:hypothetical protein